MSSSDDARNPVLDIVMDPTQDVLLATDFDGTLAPIIDDPSAARPIEGAAAALTGLAATSTEVAVISGRPVDYLLEYFPMGLTLIGLYGLETMRDGERADHPSAGAWRETISDVALSARRHGPAKMRVESKELSLTLHYREHPEIAEDVVAYALGVAEAAGLEARPARMSIELHPPIGENKGTALARLAEDHDGPVVFIGDDVGDLAAFDTLDALAADGRPVLRVAVRSDEMPAPLRERADLLLEGPPGVLEFLRGLRRRGDSSQQGAPEDQDRREDRPDS